MLSNRLRNVAIRKLIEARYPDLPVRVNQGKRSLSYVSAVYGSENRIDIWFDTPDIDAIPDTGELTQIIQDEIGLDDNVINYHPGIIRIKQPVSKVE